MVRFSKFNLVLKAESKAYKFWRAFNVKEFVKIAKHARTLIAHGHLLIYSMPITLWSQLA